MSGFSGIQDSIDNVKKKDIINNLTIGETKPMSSGAVYRPALDADFWIRTAKSAYR